MDASPPPSPPLPSAEDDEKRPPTWVVPLVMISVLTLGGWYVIQTLSDTSRMEDCTMAGRHNCVPPIDTSNGGR
jgi:hypothetical protein